MTIILIPQNIKISTQKKTNNSKKNQKTLSYKFLLLFLSIKTLSLLKKK